MTSTLLVTPAAKRSCDCATVCCARSRPIVATCNLLRCRFQIKQGVLHILFDARFQVVDLRLPLLQNGIRLLDVSAYLPALEYGHVRVAASVYWAPSALGVNPSTP